MKKATRPGTGMAGGTCWQEIESTVRCLGIESDDAIRTAETIDYRLPTRRPDRRTIVRAVRQTIQPSHCPKLWSLLSLSVRPAVYTLPTGVITGDQAMASIEYPRAEGLHQNPAYSHTVIASGKRTVYVAGQVAVDERGTIVGAGDLAAQTTQVMKNLGKALAAAGAGYEHIVKITTYVVDYKPELRPIIGKARSAFFKGTPPASTLVGVSALAAPEWMIEIEAIAVLE